jgi:methanogenic corrinoid protein MtbC1
VGDVEMRTEPRATYSLESRSLERTIEHELVPRLLLAHRAGPFPPAERVALERCLAGPDPHAVTGTDVHDFLARVLGDEEEGTTSFVRALVTRGVPVEAVYLDLLAPTANALGQLWETDSCDFLQVTIALGRMQRALRELSGDFVLGAPAADEAGRVLLSCVPGEQHTLGLYMVAEFFIRDGWGVSLGVPVTDDELLALVREQWFDVVGFSVACDSRLLRLRREIASVRRHSRNPDVRVLVGGRLFVEHPGMAGRLGADGCATSAADGPLCARRLLPIPRQLEA